MAATEGGDAGPSTVTDQLTKLLTTSVGDLEPRWARWAGTSMADAEIANYRALIAKAAEQLQDAGVQVSTKTPRHSLRRTARWGRSAGTHLASITRQALPSRRVRARRKSR